MIKLDWDDCTYYQMLKRIEIMKRSKHIQSIEIRASPSLDGYHCIVNTFDKIPRNYEYFLRREWWDDIRRLNNDMLLFNNEILMIVISRKSLNHNWDEKIYNKTQHVLEEHFSD